MSNYFNAFIITGLSDSNFLTRLRVIHFYPLSLLYSVFKLRSSQSVISFGSTVNLAESFQKI